MFGISGTELLLVGVFAFIIFGPDKIPEIMRTVNKTINMFKRTQADMERMIKAEMSGIDSEKPAGPKVAVPDEAPADTTVSKHTTASSLYGIDDDEEEDEE